MTKKKLEEEAKKKEEQKRLEEERQLEEQKLHEQLKNGAVSEEDPEGGYIAVALYDYQACKCRFYSIKYTLVKNL